ncbi:MAG: asparagine--tRNA ligase [Pseudomonadales bacterium]|nr:asparagine--tRNA ligase [Pseudomonadales bacterium]MDP6970740.1 asparagine--tRNA ligase [Pseudomonadales bacterium]
MRGISIIIPDSPELRHAMTATSIKAILAHDIPVGATVTIEGWVRSRRTSKGGFSFIHLHDGTCFDTLQAVADGSLTNYTSEIMEMGTGCSARVTGTLVESSGRGQDREIQAQKVEVVGWVDDPESYPIAKKHHTFEYLRTQAHLRPRTNTFGAIARVRNAIAQAVHGYFKRNGFIWVNTPIITASDCEGAGELFRVSTLDSINRDTDYTDDFFGAETFLTVSGQLNVESYACSMSKVYTFGPTFRAENSNTSRHLAEFWMIEPELAFADLNDLANLAEDFLKSVFAEVAAAHADDMAFFAQHIDEAVLERIQHVIDTPFTRLDYTDAVDILMAADVRFEFPVEWGLDLQSEHERFLTEKHVGGPVVVVNYPKDIKAFYMRANEDGKTVAAMDVLMPGVGEIIGGSQREERLDQLDAHMAEQGLDQELWWYRDLRRYGSVPHAGFGLGFERLVLYMTGMDNIRDVIPFPRVPKNADF